MAQKIYKVYVDDARTQFIYLDAVGVELRRRAMRGARRASERAMPRTIFPVPGPVFPEENKFWVNDTNDTTDTSIEGLAQLRRNMELLKSRRGDIPTGQFNPIHKHLIQVIRDMALEIESQRERVSNLDSQIANTNRIPATLANTDDA